MANSIDAPNDIWIPEDDSQPSNDKEYDGITNNW